MREESENLLAILKSAVRHMPFSLKDSVDRGRLLELAQEQNILPVVGEILCRNPEFRKDPLYGQTARQTVGIVACQIKRTADFLELYRAFDRAGVHPLVMKGIVCRELYGEFRDHRPSGDEDILIRPEEFETVREVLVRQGYEPERQETSERQLEEVQEITFDNPANGLCIEVHTNPIGQESVIRREMNESFRAVFENARKMSVDGTEIWTMGHTEHFLFLVLHALKHMITSSFGVRQMMDILLYDEAFGDEIRWEWVYEALENVHAERFFCDLIYIGRKYLGSDLTARYGPNCPEDLLEEMMDNGIFGSREQAYQTAASITSAAVDRRGRQSRFLTLLRSGFPSLEFMTARNPELADHPWLLPVCWLKRWGRFFQYNRENGGSLIGESIAVSEQRSRLLKKYKLL